MTTDTDTRPGTIPPWAIRAAFNGEEWLVLLDDELCTEHRNCARATIARDWPRYFIAYPGRFVPCDDGCPVLDFECNADGPAWSGDSLAEAEAAFARIEREWLGRDA